MLSRVKGFGWMEVGFFLLGCGEEGKGSVIGCWWKATAKICFFLSHLDNLLEVWSELCFRGIIEGDD